MPTRAVDTVGTDIFVVYVTILDADGNKVNVDDRAGCP